MSFRCSFRPHKVGVSCFAALSLLVIFARAEDPAHGYEVTLDPQNTLNYLVRSPQGETLLSAGLVAWGPAWKPFLHPACKDMGTEHSLSINSTFTFNASAGEAIGVKVEGASPTPNTLVYTYTLSSDKEVALSCLVTPIVSTLAKSVTYTSGGQETSFDLPINRLDVSAPISRAVFHFEGKDITLDFNPPTPVQYDKKGFRLRLAADSFKAGSTTSTVTYTFPQPVTYLASREALEKLVMTLPGKDWFPFLGDDHTGESVFAMDDWLDAPAGKHGGVRMEGDHFQLEDGTHIKFWGTNLSYSQCAPAHDVAEDLAKRFARYGINAVREHKFTGPSGWQGIGDPNDTTVLLPEGLDNLDYLNAQFTKRGIYYGFSHTFGMQVRPGNKDQLLNYQEIMDQLKGNTYGLINVAEDCQDLLIKSVTNILTHKNAYTGVTYAQDPALCYIELQNEDDIFWFATAQIVKKCPTYAKKLQERFCDWLTKRYSHESALVAAWGPLKPGESLEKKSIEPTLMAYSFFETTLAQQNPQGKQRSLDCALFLHEIQEQFYSKFVKAIRDAGYKGPLCGSPWQAPAMVPEYYNLLSDYNVGYIDRHNYFGGNDVFETMLGNPGSGYLSTGLQQVANRPFGVSEWITQWPALYQADGVVMMAAYGLGLQGWSSSYIFNSNASYPNGAWFIDKAGWMPTRRWFADSPVQIGQFPALARMIYRGDVKQGDVISTRKTSFEEISHDQFSFKDETKSGGDIKVFESQCPAAALAVGRCLVQFTEKPEPSTFPDMGKYQKGTVTTSNTGQLVWDTADKGFFTINTDGTKAVVGFANGKPQQLGNVTITSRSPYASIVLTALEQKSTLENTKSALLQVVARAASTDMTVNLLSNSVLDPGKPPLLAEPAQVDVAIAGRTIDTVHVLNQNGVLTTKTIPVVNGAFHVNTADDQTIYYQIVFK